MRNHYDAILSHAEHQKKSDTPSMQTFIVWPQLSSSDDADLRSVRYIGLQLEAAYTMHNDKFEVECVCVVTSRRSRTCPGRSSRRFLRCS